MRMAACGTPDAVGQSRPCARQARGTSQRLMLHATRAVRPCPRTPGVIVSSRAWYRRPAGAGHGPPEGRPGVQGPNGLNPAWPSDSRPTPQLWADKPDPLSLDWKVPSHYPESAQPESSRAAVASRPPTLVQLQFK